MSARAASSVLILSLLIAPGFMRPAVAGPWLPSPGEYYTELRGAVFTAKTYHDGSGDRMDLGGTWEERSLLGTVELGWKKRVSVVMALPFTGATQLDATSSRTSTGIEDCRFGLRLGLIQGSTALAAEFDWQPLLLDDAGRSLLNASWHGEGQHRYPVSASMLFGTPIANRGFLQFGTGMGFRSTTDPRLQASADLGLWLTRTVLVGARCSGTRALSDAEFYPEREVLLAGPALTWRVDDRLDLTAGSWSTAMAKNALHYDRVYVALTLKQTKLNRLQGFLGGTKAP